MKREYESVPLSEKNLMVSFITAINAMTSRSGTYGVERTPSTLFFFRVAWRKAISCW